jgi:quercetin dioxygenase-like cupin family protein
MLRRKNFIASLLITFLTSHLVYAEDLQSAIQDQGKLKWRTVSDMPPGAEVAILSGDPSKHEHFIARVRFPANYIVPAHSHNIQEFDTVITGTYYIGNGIVADARNGQAMHPGDFLSIPANLKHYGFTKEPTIIQISADGPWGMIYDTNG